MEVCPVCQVQIDGDRVLFSHGEPGTRSRLYARVCRFTKKDGCINGPQDYTENDEYGNFLDKLKALKPTVFPPMP